MNIVNEPCKMSKLLNLSTVIAQELLCYYFTNKVLKVFNRLINCRWYFFATVFFPPHRVVNKTAPYAVRKYIQRKDFCIKLVRLGNPSHFLSTEGFRSIFLYFGLKDRIDMELSKQLSL